MSEAIRILGVATDEVGQPRNDGTPGSGLYAVPFRLSGTPSGRWADAAVEAWNHPPEFSTMHRPGIARIAGDRFILDGTTIEEVERYHLKTLQLVVEVANRADAEGDRRDQDLAEQRKAEEEAHRRTVDEVSKRLKFE